MSGDQKACLSVNHDVRMIKLTAAYRNVQNMQSEVNCMSRAMRKITQRAEDQRSEQMKKSRIEARMRVHGSYFARQSKENEWGLMMESTCKYRDCIA